MTNIAKRLFIIALMPLMFVVTLLALVLELPFWLFTGKGIVNPVVEGILELVDRFLG